MKRNVFAIMVIGEKHALMCVLAEHCFHVIITGIVMLPPGAVSVTQDGVVTAIAKHAHLDGLAPTAQFSQEASILATERTSLLVHPALVSATHLVVLSFLMQLKAHST